MCQAQATVFLPGERFLDFKQSQIRAGRGIKPAKKISAETLLKRVAARARLAFACMPYSKDLSVRPHQGHRVGKRNEKQTYYNVTFARTYTDAAGHPQDTDSFGRDHHPLVAKLAD